MWGFGPVTAVMLKPFGCRAWSWKPVSTRTDKRLGPAGIEGIFVGSKIHEGSRVYRVYNPVTKCIHEGTHIKHDPDDFPGLSGFNCTSVDQLIQEFNKPESAHLASSADAMQDDIVDTINRICSKNPHSPILMQGETLTEEQSALHDRNVNLAPSPLQPVDYHLSPVAHGLDNLKFLNSSSIADPLFSGIPLVPSLPTVAELTSSRRQTSATFDQDLEDFRNSLLRQGSPPPSPTKTPGKSPAPFSKLASAVDDFAANLEATFSHLRPPDFPSTSEINTQASGGIKQPFMPLRSCKLKNEDGAQPPPSPQSSPAGGTRKKV